MSVVIVTFEAEVCAKAYVRETDLRWPLVVDASRDLYSAYEMERGRWWHIFGPAAWWIYAKLLANGRQLRRPTGDVRQLGGDVLIDPSGIVRLHYVGVGPADRPSISLILNVARST